MLTTQAEKFLHELFMGFRVQRIEWNAIHRAHLDTLRSIEMPNAFGTFRRIDHVVVNSLEIASLGQTGSHTSQLMHVSMILRDKASESLITRPVR